MKINGFKKGRRKMISKNNYYVDTPKATVLFTPEAMSKMLILIMETDVEIGWHGICHKIRKGLYQIDDIVIYPQKVASATVNVDDKEYGLWRTDYLLHEAERGTIRMHGHSHVNMKCASSGVDRDLQEDDIKGLPDDGYYIHLIMNKKLECYFRIHDNADGIEYESPNVQIELTSHSLSQLAIDYANYVKRVAYQSPTYGAYSGAYGSCKKSSSTQGNKPTKQATKQDNQCGDCKFNQTKTCKDCIDRASWEAEETEDDFYADCRLYDDEYYSMMDGEIAKIEKGEQNA